MILSMAMCVSFRADLADCYRPRESPLSG